MLSVSLGLALLEDPGDSAQYAAFFSRYHRLVLHRAASYVKTREAAEDVAQEVLLYAAQHFDQFRDRSDHRAVALLLFCTHSRAVDYLRQSEKFNCVELEDEDDLPPADPAEQITVTAETLERVLAQVAALPQAYRIPLKLRMEDMPYAEIAELLNLSKDAVYKRVQRAYAMIRERMAEEDGP